MGTLYVVATPIGNLEDITLRALRLLASVDLIAAEDTRTARKLLTAHKIKTPRLLSFNDHNRKVRIPAILQALDEIDVALISEAGTPGVSDPGIELVAAAAAAGHRVEPVPGASALTAALAASALSTRRVRYLGFLPRRSGERKALLKEAAPSADALVIFEAPHRLRATLNDLHSALGDRRIAVCRELTKLHEEIVHGSLAELAERAASGTIDGRGELVIVLGEGRAAARAAAASASDSEVESRPSTGVSQSYATTPLRRRSSR